MINIHDPRFNRTFELPADPSQGRHTPFKIKYADYGYRNEAHPEEENVLLFFGPMFASRLVHIAKDELATKHKIRFINPDRPGIGGTDPADPAARMALWRDAIPALLRHLDIAHVSLAAHSAGTIYALDLLLHRPSLLHPSRPYLALGAPWVLPVHTASMTSALVKHLPAGLIGNFDKVASLVNSYVGPVIGASSVLAAKLTPASKDGEPVAAEVKAEEEVWPAVMKQIYAEGVQGVSAEAVLLMQKVHGATGWSDWGDYDALVPRLVGVLRVTAAMAVRGRVKVDVFYAESDHMIGEGGSKGPVWFDGCWVGPRTAEVVEYGCRTVPGADHDGLWGLRWGVMQEVFGKVGQLGDTEGGA
ncbi:hypothetical protein B0T19DRAFT_355064 [Cercophora scortea]|uniref:AB hydrolase-1 domain-containing protein n=1 Tax=Cercophora scortea TaxID=314031 RepID=A0AAE0MGL8_9PEZI|nr:hypothetical protein B0T19DRAFT_355064 [Cercophora scortea]